MEIKKKIIIENCIYYGGRIESTYDKINSLKIILDRAIKKFNEQSRQLSEKEWNKVIERLGFQSALDLIKERKKEKVVKI